MLAVSFDTDTGFGDLVYASGHLVDSGSDLETAALLSLLCDAPAQDGDALPAGTPRRGFWADIFDATGERIGSRLWLLEGAEATEQTAQRAKAYAAEALQWMIRDRHVLSIAYATQVGDEAVELSVVLTLRDGREVPLGPFRVTG